MLIKPLEQCISPRRADMREDFPEPTAPTTATNWPGLISKDTLVNTHRRNMKLCRNKCNVLQPHGVLSKCVILCMFDKTNFFSRGSASLSQEKELLRMLTAEPKRGKQMHRVMKTDGQRGQMNCTCTNKLVKQEQILMTNVLKVGSWRTVSLSRSSPPRNFSKRFLDTVVWSVKKQVSGLTAHVWYVCIVLCGVVSLLAQWQRWAWAAWPGEIGGCWKERWKWKLSRQSTRCLSSPPQTPQMWPETPAKKESMRKKRGHVWRAASCLFARLRHRTHQSRGTAEDEGGDRRQIGKLLHDLQLFVPDVIHLGLEGWLPCIQLQNLVGGKRQRGGRGALWRRRKRKGGGRIAFIPYVINHRWWTQHNRSYSRHTFQLFPEEWKPFMCGTPHLETPTSTYPWTIFTQKRLQSLLVEMIE